MKTRIFRAQVLLVLLFRVLGQFALGSQIYIYKVVAQTDTATAGGLTLNALDKPTAINAAGHVALTGECLGGQALLLWDGHALQPVSIAAALPFGSPWINASDEIVTSFSARSGGNAYSSINRYFISGIPSGVISIR